MMAHMAIDAVRDVSTLLIQVGLADLASWQEAGISFGFVFVMILVGFLLERLGVGLHA